MYRRTTKDEGRKIQPAFFYNHIYTNLEFKIIRELLADYRIMSCNLQGRNMTLEIDRLLEELTQSGFGY